MMVNLGCGNRWHKDWINLDFHSNSEFVQKHNLYEPLPFEEHSVDAIYSSHVLEHFPKYFAPKFLKECYRVLKKGGLIRVVIPDLEQITKNYLIFLEQARRGDSDAAEKYDWTLIELFDQMIRNLSGGEMLEYWKQKPMPQEEFVLERVGSEVKNTLNAIRANPQNYPKKDCLEQNFEAIGRFRLSGEVHQWMYDSFSLSRLLAEAGFSTIEQHSAISSKIPDFSSYLLDIEEDGSTRKPDSLFMEAVKP